MLIQGDQEGWEYLDAVTSGNLVFSLLNKYKCKHKVYMSSSRWHKSGQVTWMGVVVGTVV